MDGGGTKLHGEGAAACKATLAMECTENPMSWNKMVLYNIPNCGSGVTAQGFTDYTAEFLLTRGPYAILGYSWCGCTNGEQERPRAAEWDEDFGIPHGACREKSAGSGVYTRTYSKATVEWDCNAGAQRAIPASCHPTWHTTTTPFSFCLMRVAYVCV